MLEKGARIGEGTELAFDRRGIFEQRRHLDQFRGPARVAGEEVDLEATRCSHPGDVSPAPQQLDENNILQSVAKILPARSIERMDKPGIDRICLAGIHLALALGSCFDGDTMDQKRVLQVAKDLQQPFDRDPDLLRA